MDIDITQFLVELAIVLVPIVAGYAVRVWRQNAAAIEKKIEAEIGETWWNLIETAANTLIHAAEQASGIDTNEEKKAFVLYHLNKLVAEWNIPLTTDQLDAILVRS